MADLHIGVNKKNLKTWNQLNTLLIIRWFLHQYGFSNGEGRFKSYVMLVLQCEFNITQLMNDVLLLEAINEYFHNKGGVYSRENLEKYMYLKIYLFFMNKVRICKMSTFG